MPDKLCKECTEKAFIAYNFKVVLEQSDTTLRNIFKDQIQILKKDTVFDENSHAYLGLGIKTEIAFVDADPFIDDDGDFDYVQATTGSSVVVSHPQNDNNNSYSQHEEEILDSEDENDLDDDEEDENENFEDKSSKDRNIKKKLVSPKTTDTNVEYVKDEEGKFVCQICNKKLVDKKGFNLHIRLHTGENLKRCSICNRGELLKFIFILNFIILMLNICRFHQKRSSKKASFNPRKISQL